MGKKIINAKADKKIFTFFQIMNTRIKQIQFFQKNTNSIQQFNSLTKFTCVPSLLFSSFSDEKNFLKKRHFVIFSSIKEKTQKNTKYTLQKYQRSNQDTLIFQRPLVREGEWIQSGDILADCSTSLGGELCLGKNIYIAYMPWEGYNYEDAILISQRLVTEDIYTSIHIESYEVETRNTKLGKEQITKKIPEVSENQIFHLDERGIAKRGTSVKEGDILVGKVTPVQKKFVSAYEKLLYTILEKELIPMRDTSLRTPKGLKAKVLEVKILGFSSEKNQKILKKKNFVLPKSKETLDLGRPIFKNSLNKNLKKKNKNKKLNFLTSFLFSKYPYGDQNFQNIFTSAVKNPFYCQGGDKKNLLIIGNLDLNQSNLFSLRTPIHSPFVDGEGGKEKLEPQIHFSIHSDLFQRNIQKKTNEQKNFAFFVPFFSKNKKILKKKKYLFSFFGLKEKNIFKKFYYHLSRQNQNTIFSLKKKNHQLTIPTNKNFQKPEKVQVYLVEKRRIQVGDKMSGRHGNKGIVSQILPVPDMPFLPDGTPLDMVLNPLGVPSRMNVGQIYECILGLASKYLQQYYRIQPFDEIYGPQASRSFTFSKLYEARQKTSQKWLFNPCYPGKIQIFDGQTGEPYENPVTVGISYILKLVHLVDDKIHARSTGPYSLVTQQPLKGRSKYGGQRLGEMEVWAIEAYGAAFVLLEMLTIKSDDISGRMTLWSNILLNMPIYIGTPESFKVLVCELQALCLDMGLFRLNKKGFLTQVEHLMQLP
mgnify:CR=1 FL=1